MANPTPIKPGIKANGAIRGLTQDDVQSLLLRSQWGKGLGLTFGGSRDLYDVFGYKTALSPLDYENAYNRGGIAKRIVEAPVDACWADPPMITGNPRFIKVWNDLVTRQKVFNVIERLDILAGLGQFAVLLIGYDDGKPLSQPVNKNSKNIIYLQPYGEARIAITKFEENTSSPRFGLPLIYEIEPGDNVLKSTKNISSTTIRNKITVHYSRILHVAEGVTDNPLVGHSRLEAVYNYLDDLTKVSGGAAETYWLVANRGLHIDVDKEVDLDEDSAAALSDEVAEYQHQMRRFIRTRGVKINNLGSDTSDPRGTFEVLVNLISGTTGIPQRILLGSEAGQLASEQDRANWANRVQERISRYAGPTILMPFIEMQIQNGALPVPNKMTVEWPDAFKLSPLERGQAAAQMARSAANVVKALTTPIAIDGSGVVEVTTMVEQTTPGQDTTDATGKTIKGKPTTTMVPQVTVKPSTTLFTVEEARSIVGFGKHAPIFDDAQDSDPTNKPDPNKSK